MKAKNYILVALSFIGIVGGSCSDTWDEHYLNDESKVNNNSITIVNESLTNYLSHESSLSSMHQLFTETGMIEELQKKEQMYTILAVESAIPASADEKKYVAQTYISDASISPSNMVDGQRILMWNAKYLNISKTETETGETTIKFNNATVTKITKLTNGYLYILDQAVNSPRSMYEIIENLGDDYSIFREMILSRNELTFDKEASTIIGVDNTGNTVYDSIFTVKAPYFEKKGFDIMSENLTATMLIPSNEIVTEALSTARQKLSDWGLVREDSILENWIFQSVFFKKVYSKQDFDSNEDLTSVFSQQWRTTIQKVDLDNPIAMSNGTAYHVTKMKIPTNVLIYRLKDCFYYYQYLTAEEKETYYKATNLAYKEVKDNGNHPGWAAMGFPKIYYYTLMYDLADPTNKSYTLDFTPFMYESTGGSDHKLTPYKVPAGTYEVCVGFAQEKNKKLGNITIYVNGEKIGTVSESAHSSTTYHYDRGGNNYPEGFDASAASKAGVSKPTNYGRDGGMVGTITITGEAKPIVIRYEASGNSLSQAILYHWCLKPTIDCY